MRASQSVKLLVILALVLGLIVLLQAAVAQAAPAAGKAASVAAPAATLPVIDDFEVGLPAGLNTFSDRQDNPPNPQTVVTVTTATEDLPTIPPITDTTVLSFSYYLALNGWNYAYGGFNRAFATPQDWSGYGGFSFWFYGVNSGNTIEIELWDGPTQERFEYEFVDDMAGWRLFKLDFTDFVYATDWQPGGNPVNGILDLTAMEGYNFGIVTVPSSGRFMIDNVELYVTPAVIDDFEVGLPAGLNTFSDRQDNPPNPQTVVTVTTATEDLPTIPPITDTTVLSFSYYLALNGWNYAYGGFYRAFATPQDWSGYDGLSFWFYGVNSGNTIEVELWDGPTQERFEYEFLDDVAGWRLFKLDFTDFVYATDWQPGGNPVNGILDLTAMEGYNFGIVTVPSSGRFMIDNVELYSDQPLSWGVDFDRVGYSANEDAGTATITVTLNAAASVTITVDYATQDGTAVAGSDYTTATGTLTFTPGITTLNFTVPILDDAVYELHETVVLSLSNPTNASIGYRNPATLIIANDDTPPDVAVIWDFESGLPSGLGL